MSALGRIVLKKSFLAERWKFLGPLMRFVRGNVRDPHRFTQNRPRTCVAALKGVAAVEKSKNQLSRDFRCRPIFDFCNSIGSKADITGSAVTSAFDPTETWGSQYSTSAIRCRSRSSVDRRHDCHRLVQCGVTIDARSGTSDPDNCCPATKPELTLNLDTAGSSSFSAVCSNRHGFSERNH